MRKKTRDETPNAKTFRHANYKTAYEKKVSNSRVSLIENPKLTGREAALAALARMKEKERTLKLHSVRVDRHTVLCSNKAENLKMRVKEYTSPKRTQI